MQYVYLGVAILCETIATSALKASKEFTEVIPAAITVVMYVASFYLLALTLRTIPVGIAYAIWSGTGVVLITIIGWFWFKQSLDVAAMLGIGLIVAGVLVLNLFSKTVGH